jgi:hypothetical protein
MRSLCCLCVYVASYLFFIFHAVRGRRDIIACRVVTMQRPRHKQIHAEQFLDIGSVNTFPLQRIRMQQGVVLETGFPTLSAQMGLYGGQLKQDYFSWNGAAVQRGLGPGSRGITIVRSRYQATTREDIAGWKRLSVICKVWKLAMAL